MDEISEPPARGWRIDLNEPLRVLPDDAEAALTRASEELAILRSRTPGEKEWESARSAVCSAALLGANEHEIAVATGLTLEGVRLLLQGT